ncbi:MAG: ribonuclease III [Bifidobacteriaceae bacterium]|jgi:ribonuclease-3|nr:ribonuclease III [Bifidobacteriaceae bacterium]
MTEPAALRPEAVTHLLDWLGCPVDAELLVLALTHRSFAHEAGGIPTNERLEFLGDSVLGLVATEFLYREHPELPEGELAKMRAASVSQRALAAVARTADLGSYVLLGRGEQTTGGAQKDSILSDTLEALIGAAYLCNGIETARSSVLKLLGTTLEAAANLGAGLDWKTSLQELVTERGMGMVEYRSQGAGPDHARVFDAQAVADNLVLGAGSGSAKKVAEQRAAEAAYNRLLTEQGGSPTHLLKT